MQLSMITFRGILIEHRFGSTNFLDVLKCEVNGRMLSILLEMDTPIYRHIKVKDRNHSRLLSLLNEFDPSLPPSRHF